MHIHIYFFLLIENSSLNMFYSPNGREVFISTATTNLPGPIIVGCKYPLKCSSQKYESHNCNHKFEHYEFRQTRRADEAPTSVVQCILCKILKFS